MAFFREGLRRLARLSLPGTARKQVDPKAVSADYVRDVILAALDFADDWRVEGPVVLGRSNHIFKAESARAPYPLAVKVFVPETRAGWIEARAKTQRNVHERLGACSGLAVPALFATLPEHRTIVMEWVDEPSIRALLTAAGRNRDRRAALFSAAGRWLRAYHDQGGIEMLPFRAAQINDVIGLNPDRKAGTTRDRSTASYRAARRVLLDVSKYFDGESAPHAPVHGDFHGKNLFYRPERIVGIDLGDPVLAPVATDICHFLVQAETTKPFLTHKPTLESIGIERRDLDSFLSAYDPRRELIDIEHFRYVFLPEVLRRWTAILGRSKGPFHAVRYTKHFRLRRMARYTTAAVGGQSRVTAQ